MSFAYQVKVELTQIEVDDYHARAELSALIRMNGTLIFSNGQMALDIQTENAAIAKRIYLLLKEHFATPAEFIVRRKMKLRKNNVYIVRVQKELVNLLTDLHIMEDMMLTANVSSDIMGDDQLMRSYLRGAFEAGGSINPPGRSSYHLEIYSHEEEHNNDICQMMNFFELNARTIKRRNGFITYVKEAEKISDFLAIIGANQALLKYENARVVRDLRNNVNRIVNAENANMNKTIDASSRQIENIKLIDVTIGLDQLPDKVREIAHARLENPDVSMAELGEILPSGQISKSAVNHRLRKINEKADEIREKGVAKK